MAIRIRSVEDLAKELKLDKKQTLAKLRDLGIKIIDGHFDVVRFEAAVSEPQWLRDKRNEWSLSPRVGLGAVKHVLDPLGIVIVEHECRGSQYLMLRSGKAGSAGRQMGTSKVYCKMYYKGTFTSDRSKSVAFNINNFLAEDSQEDYYLCMCFEGPTMWVFPKTELASIHRKLSKKEYGSYDKELTIAHDQWERAAGGLHGVLGMESAWLLTSAEQLGL